MKLDDLEKEREVDPHSPLPLDAKEICRRYEKLFTAAVNDALRERRLLRHTLPHELVPLRENMRVAGFAFTIKGAQNLTLRNEMNQRAQMLDELPEDSVVVWDTTGDRESAQWGECMTMAAQRRKCRGAIVDGGVRDTDKVLELGFPLWVRYRSSNGMLGRFRISAWQTPVQLGGVMVNPGDLILADLDGALCVPRQIVLPILERAEEIAQGESEFKQWILEGMPAQEIVRRGGYF